MKTNLMKCFTSHSPPPVSDVNMVAEPKVSVLLAGNTLVSFLFLIFTLSHTVSLSLAHVSNKNFTHEACFQFAGASDGPKATKHDEDGK
jgi:hypothetical protein